MRETTTRAVDTNLETKELRMSELFLVVGAAGGPEEFSAFNDYVETLLKEQKPHIVFGNESIAWQVLGNCN